MKRFLFLALVLLGTVSLSAKKVTVTVYPPTATLTLKGKEIPSTSTPGVYDLTVSIMDLVFTAYADGYDPKQFVVNLKSPLAFPIYLEPNRKQVSVSSEPNTATIYVDGRLMGKGVVDFSINKNETKIVKIEQEGYDTYIKRIGFNDQTDINMSYNLVLDQNRREVNVLIDVPAAEFLVENISVAKGTNRATFYVHKGKDVKLLIKAEGYYDYERTLSFYDEQSSYNLTKDLIVDQAYAESVPGSDIANKDVIIQVSKDITRDSAIQRLSFHLSEEVGELKDRDNVTGYYSTVWVAQTLGNKCVRTRAILKQMPDFGDGDLKFKLRIESQKADKLNPSDQDYSPWGRLLKIYQDLPMELTNMVQK